jgi:hypothetical protein
VDSPAPPASTAPPEPPTHGRAPRFDPPNVLWYFGGISATLAANVVAADTGAAHRGLWIFLVGLLFFAAAAALSAVAQRAGWWIPAGVLTAAAVGLVPAVVVGFEHLIGTWPRHPASIEPFQHFVGSAFTIAAVTAAAGLAAFWLVRFAFVLLAVVVAGALGIQLLLPAVVTRPGVSDHLATLIVTGAVFVVVGMLLDARRHRRAAFWWHVGGLVAVANGLVYYVGVNPVLPGHHSAVWAWVAMVLVGAALVVASFPVRRATWAVFGVAGLYVPALHYVGEASGAWRTPLLMVFISLGLMIAGALLDTVGAAWPQRLARPVVRPRT